MRNKRMGKIIFGINLVADAHRQDIRCASSKLPMGINNLTHGHRQPI